MNRLLGIYLRLRLVRLVVSAYTVMIILKKTINSCIIRCSNETKSTETMIRVSSVGCFTNDKHMRNFDISSSGISLFNKRVAAVSTAAGVPAVINPSQKTVLREMRS